MIRGSDEEFRQTVISWLEIIDKVLEEIGHGNRNRQGKFLSVIKTRDSYGIPRLSPNWGGLVYTFKRGTNEFQNTHMEEERVTVNPNPVMLDSEGAAQIYWDGDYTVRVTDVSGKILEVFDREKDGSVKKFTAVR